MRRELPVVPSKGRGSRIYPPNRFGVPYRNHNAEPFDGDDGFPPVPRDRPTEFFPDRSAAIVTENDSRDVGFRFSLDRRRRLAKFVRVGLRIADDRPPITRTASIPRAGGPTYQSARAGIICAFPAVVSLFRQLDFPLCLTVFA